MGPQVSPARESYSVLPANCRAIGFDLGETLLTYRDTPLNWTALYPDALAQMAAAIGATPTPAHYADAADVLARHNTRLHPRTTEVTAEAIFAEILAAWNLPPAALPDAIAAFFDFFQQRLVAYPETLATLQALRARGIRIGILTDVPYGMPREFVQRDLAHAGIADLIDVLLTSVDVGHRKPDPSGFHALARALDIPTAELIYVGNEPKDIAGPLATGAQPILIERETALENPTRNTRHRTIRSLSELL